MVGTDGVDFVFVINARLDTTTHMVVKTILTSKFNEICFYLNVQLLKNVFNATMYIINMCMYI